MSTDRERVYADALSELRQMLRSEAVADDAFRNMRSAKRRVLERFQPAFRRPERLELETFREFLSFKNNQHWTGLNRQSTRLLNDAASLRRALTLLTNEKRPLAARIDEAREQVEGLGPAIASAFLLVTYPEQYGVLNGTSGARVRELGLMPDGWTRMTVGERYEAFNPILLRLAKDLELSLWDLDALWWVGKPDNDADEDDEEPAKSVWEEAFAVLAASAEPLHASEILRRMLAAGYEPGSVTPEKTVEAEISTRLVGNTSSRNKPKVFRRTSSRTYTIDPAARERGLADVKGEGSVDAHAILARWLGSAEDDRRTREQAEERARALLAGNLGALSEAQLREVMRHLNTCQGAAGNVVYNRFSPAFVGHNANKLVECLPRLNPLIERLWRADPEQIDGALDAFLAAGLPGAGRSMPSAVLYLRDPERHPVWTQGIDQALARCLPGTRRHDESASGYSAFCREIRRLLDPHGVPASLRDKALWVLNDARPSPATALNEERSAFVGFSEDSFGFLNELSANNREDWFEKQRARFREQVDHPLRSLLVDLGARVLHALDPNLAVAPKSGKTISKIRRASWERAGSGVYRTWLGASIYRRERVKDSEAQLFLTLRARGFSHGLYLPETAPESVKRLSVASKSRAGVVQAVLLALAEDGFAFSGAADDHAATRSVHSPEELRELLRGGALRVYRDTPASDAVAEGPELAERVGEDLRQLYALFALATDEALADEDILDFLRPASSDREDEAAQIEAAITSSTLSERTYLDVAFFDRLDRLLADKRQLILHGPAGTGKTLVALEYAKYLAQRGGDIVVVQFHPSYGYEDFVEGLRPIVEDGQLQYRVERGIFRVLCDRARANPKARFVLLVDEINRGNLPRIFGELLFLLERRDQSVVLPYSKQAFSVPENVCVLGTMNSADRSIALLDLALRRRFHFVAMAPSEDVLRSWLEAHGQPLWLADVLTVLNAELEAAGIDPGRLLGHSHFMSGDFDETKLELVWEASIEPLLTELFFSEPERLATFTLKRMLERVRRLSTPPPASAMA